MILKQPGVLNKVSSVIPAYSSQQTGSTTYTFDTFATSFEKAMIIPGAVAYYAASGVDRTRKHQQQRRKRNMGSTC